MDLKTAVTTNFSFACILLVPNLPQLHLHVGLCHEQVMVLLETINFLFPLMCLLT